MTTKNVLRRIIPTPIRSARARARRLTTTLTQLAPAYWYDARRYLTYSSSNGPHRTRENLRAKITATYHNIEKGLVLPEPRPGFGTEQIATLIRLINDYVDTYGWDPWLSIPVAVLRAYMDFNDSHNKCTVNDVALVLLLLRSRGHLPEIPAGTKKVHRSTIRQAVAGVTADFFTTRSSVRQYANEDVDPADVEFAVNAALHAPAVCNRQYNQIHTWEDPDQIGDILNIQRGARGFANQLGGLAIITSDLRNFWGAGERNQAYIDGGLFAMNFINGLHARGLGTIALNWSKTPEDDRALRQLTGLPAESVIIMLIGYGVLRDTYTVAVSHRTPAGTAHIRH